jgi:hypothetical protein
LHAKVDQPQPLDPASLGKSIHLGDDPRVGFGIGGGLADQRDPPRLRKELQGQPQGLVDR